MSETETRSPNTTTWCRWCQQGNHAFHTDSGGLCSKDNAFNADCRCPLPNMQGAHYVNIVVRRNGRDEVYEADALRV